MSQTHWEVIVVGAGPAGALSALLAARSGASTLLVERKRFPRVKVCGGCLNASAVALLDTLGLGAIASEFGQPVHQLELGLNGKRVRLQLPGGVTIPRTRLDSELVQHAVAAGAHFLPETSASLGIENPAGRQLALASAVGERVVEGKVIVLAAGLGGPSSQGEDPFETTVATHSRIGLGCVVESYSEVYQAGTIAMAIGNAGYVGLTPTIEGLAIASALDPNFLKSQGGPAFASAAILQEAGFPEVAAMKTADWSGTLPLTRKTRPLAAGRVFLVGDSAGYVEPFTGQGMAIALQGAAALAPFVNRAVEAWSPVIGAAWGHQYSQKIGSRYWPAALVAALSRSPRLAGWAVGLAGALPILPGILIGAVNRPVFDPLSP